MRKAILVIVLFFIFMTLLNAREKDAYKIKVLTIEGNKVYTTRTLKKVLVTRNSRFLSPAYFYPTVFEQDLKNLTLFYNQNGYLEAKVLEYDVDEDHENRTVAIFIRIYEGPPTHISDIAIFGNHVFTDETILSSITMGSGQLLNQKRIQDATYKILSMYGNQGYLDAEAVPDIRINKEINKAIIDFQITENQQFTIHDIHIQGLDITKERVIWRNITFQSGEIVNYSRILKSQQNLYLTGIFESVFIRPVTIDSLPTQKDILIEIQEKIPGEFNLGVGYGSLDKFRVFFELVHNNFRGTAQKIGLNVKLSSITKKVEAAFTEPWTFGIKLKTDINIFASYNKEPGYSITQRGGKISVGKDLTAHSNALISYMYERVQYKNVVVDNVDYAPNLNTVSLSYSFDSRDNIFNTTKGLYLSGDNDVVISYHNTKNIFDRVIINAKYFIPGGETTIFGFSTQIGFMKVFGNDTSIPLNERFFAGGPNSIRGFEYRKVGPISKNVPVGGRYKFVGNLEVRQRLYKAFSGVAFFDFGNVWSYLKDIPTNALRSSPGIGLRFATPIGVVRCDYGFNWFPKDGEPSGTFYFSLGQAF